MTDDRPAAAPRLSAIFTHADALRDYFRERGWTIHMEDNGRDVIDPFAAIIESAEAARPTPEPAPAYPLSVEAVQHALDKAWLASNDAHGMARPPDLARHLSEALRASSRGASR